MDERLFLGLEHNFDPCFSWSKKRLTNASHNEPINIPVLALMDSNRLSCEAERETHVSLCLFGMCDVTALTRNSHNTGCVKPQKKEQ